MAELAGDDSVFSCVLSAFRRRLSPQDITDFQSTTLEDLQKEITRIQEIQVQHRCVRNLTKVKPFLDGIGQYSKVIEVFVSAKPDIMAFIWGPMKLCLQIASKLNEAFDALLDAYEKIGKSLPLFSKIDQLFRSQSYVQQVLVDVYEDVLDFHKRAIIFFKQSARRLAFKVTFHTFADMFGDVIKKLERSKELLLHSADIAHYHATQEFRLRIAQEFEAQLERTRKDRMLTVIDWLSPTSCEVDHEELQRKRHEFPDTTRWIFNQDSMRRWLQPDERCNPMFWICGIPGAGKTVLFSSIVDQIKDVIPKSQVIFFYCKNRDPLKNTFHAIARSLITQLLRLNPVSLDHVHETAVNSGERHPSTFKTYRSILEHITSIHGSLFIGIDGLDECEKDDRCRILSLLDHVLKASSPEAKIKIFLTSQRMNDLENSLKSAIRFDIKHHHVKQDIEHFVDKRALQLCDKFSLSLEKKNSITARISNRSEGMFLLARLIMDNLMAQDSIEELEEELSTEILPKGINEAYERILFQLSKGPLKKSQERATRALELIITARYPLKIQELQGALAIRLEDTSVEFATRRTFTPFTELCGPIVEVHADDTISLVHPTAKLYLIQDHSGPFINLRASLFRMANLCAQYLNFECFGSLHNIENQAYVAAGAYAFQEHATLNWIYHTQLLFKSDPSHDRENLTALMKACILLKSAPCRLPSKSLSLENMDQEIQDFRAEMRPLREVYESVYSISDDERSGDSIPYLLRHLFQTRSMIEKSFATANPPSETMTEAYGTRVFKCSLISCSNFRHGFLNNAARDKHQKKHQGQFECTHKGCEFSIYGFSTTQELEKHLIEHNPPPNTICFPKVRRCSLESSLKSAIDQDNAVAVRALCAEGSELSSNLLKRALSKKSHNATKVLLQLLSTKKNMKTYARTAMRLAAEKGDEELANLVIAMGADSEPQGSETSPLSLAAKGGYAPIVKLLLDQSGGDLDLTGKEFKALLVTTAEGGHEAVLSILLDKHGKAYTKKKVYYRAIISAGLKDDETAVRLLLKTGHKLHKTDILPKEVRDLAPNIDFMSEKIIQIIGRDRQKAADYEIDVGKVTTALEAGADISTLLSIAARWGRLAQVQELLDRGADINADGGRGTALEEAAERGERTVAKVLLNRKADVNAGNRKALHIATENGDIELVKLLLHWKADVDLHGLNGMQALHLAASKSHQIIVGLLYDAGADINAKDSSSSNTALHIAAGDGQDGIVNLLLEMNADTNSKNCLAVTPLLLAAMNGWVTTVNLLLDYRADISAQSLFLDTALHQTARDGHLSVVKLLLERNINANQKNLEQETALHLAASKGRESIVSLLLEHGADINAKSEISKTALHRAAENGHLSVIKLLLGRSVDVNQKDSNQETALHFAVRGVHEDVVSLLLANGADSGSKNKWGHSPLDLDTDSCDGQLASSIPRWGYEQ